MFCPVTFAAVGECLVSKDRITFLTLGLSVHSQV